MITLFGGSDTYESYLQAKKTVRSLSDEHSLPVKIMDLDSLMQVDELLQALESVGMFSESNIVLGKRPLKNKLIRDYLSENLDRLSQYHLVLWEDTKPDGKLSLVKKLKKSKQIKLFELPKPWKIEEWVSSICKLKDIKLSRSQIHILVEQCESNKNCILSELQKLKLFNSKDKQYDDRDFEAVIGLDAKGNIWKLLESFVKKDFDGTYAEYKKLMQFDGNVFYLLSMISREISLLADVIVTRERGGDFKALGIHPFVLQKTMKASQKFTLEELLHISKGINLVEQEIKTGKLQDDVAFKKFLVNTLI